MWQRSNLGLKWKDYLVGPPPDNDTLAGFYFRAKEEGVIDSLMHESLKPDVVDFLDGLSDERRGDNKLVGMWRLTSDVATLVGFGCSMLRLDGGGYRRHEVYYAFLPEPGVSVFDKVCMTQAAISHLFETTDTGMIYGVTPTGNFTSIIFSKRVGLLASGAIPGFCGVRGVPCPGVILSTTRERWLNSKYHKVVD